LLNCQNVDYTIQTLDEQGVTASRRLQPAFPPEPTGKGQCPGRKASGLSEILHETSPECAEGLRMTPLLALGLFINSTEFIRTRVTSEVQIFTVEWMWYAYD